MPDTTLVRDVMTPKVMTLRADQAIGDAADEMAAHKYGAMPVVDSAGKLLGLLRDEDFIVSEARVHVPTYISLLGVSFQLPSHVDEELRKVAGSTVGEVMEERSAHDHGGRHARRPGDGDARNGGVARPGRRRERHARRHRRPRRHRAVHRPDDVTALPARLGRDRSRRGARQRARAARPRAAGRRCCAVVKADGYGHGAVPVGRAALDAGASCLGVALVEEGVELRDAGIDAPVLVLSEPVPEAAETVVAAPAHARSCTPPAASTRWPRRSPTERRASRSTSTSRSTPACTASAARPRTRSTSRAHVVDAPELALAGVLHALRGRRRARRTRTPPSSRSASTPCSRELRATASDRASCTRATPRARSRSPRRALRHGARRHRRSTASRRRRAGGPGRAAARAVGEGARVARARTRRPASASRTGCATRPTRATRIATVPDRLRRRRAARARRSAAARCSSAGGAARSRARSRWTS